MKIINHMLDRIPLVGVIMLMIPLWPAFLGGRFPYSFTLLPICAIIVTSIGYFTQSFFAYISGKRRSFDGFGSVYQGVLSRFRFRYAVIPIIIFSILSVIASYFFNLIMNVLLEGGVIKYHDPILVLFFIVLFMTSAVSGCVIWFYPTERLSNFYVLTAGGVFFLIESVMLFMSGYQLTKTITALTIAVPFTVYILCVFIIYNQSNLQKQYRGSVVSVITPSARLYNLILVLILIFIMGVLAVAAFFVIGGLFLILRRIFYLILYTGFRNLSAGSYDEYEYVAPKYEEQLEDIKYQLERNVISADDQFIIAVFVLIAVSVILISIGMKNGYIKNLLILAKNWIAEVIMTVLIGIDIIKSVDVYDREDNLNYKDEKKTIDRSDVKDYYRYAAETESYNDFLIKLDRMESYDEQLCYSYSVLLRMYRKMNVNLKSSDTPRQVEGKVRCALTADEIEKITADFERIRYSGEEIATYEAADVLKNICKAVKKYMF